MIKQTLFLFAALLALVAGQTTTAPPPPTPIELLVTAVLSDDAAEINRTITELGAVMTDTVDGLTPGCYGSISGNYGSVETLILHGLDVHEVGCQGMSLVCAAANAGKTATAQLLIESGASVTAYCDGYSAFHKACEGHFKNTIQMMLESGANVDDQTETGLKCADLVEGDVPIEALLLEYSE